ncbi:MAG TPA: hypothetical protein VL625_09155 [Patescibacteria group bacterium]|nr:hypothetical protein [Patescibacteria group bacterium]
MSDLKFTGDAATQAQKIAAARADLKLLGRGVADNASPDDVLRVMKDYIEEKGLRGPDDDVDAIRTIHRQALNQILARDNNSLWDVQKRLYYLDESHEMGTAMFMGEGSMAPPPEVEVRPQGKADQIPGTVDRLMDYNGTHSKGFRSAQDEIAELQRLSRTQPPAANPRYQWDPKMRALCNDYVAGEVGSQINASVGQDGIAEMQAALEILGYDKNVPTGTWSGSNAQGVSKFISDTNTWHKPPIGVDWANPDSIKNFRQYLFEQVKGRVDYDKRLVNEHKDLALAAPDGMDKDAIRQAQLYMNIVGVHGKETVTHTHTFWFDTHPEVDFTYGKSPTGDWTKRDAQAVEAYCKEKGLNPDLGNADNRKKFFDALKGDVQKKLGDGVNVDNYTTLMMGLVDGKHSFTPDKPPPPPETTPPDQKTGPDNKTPPVKTPPVKNDDPPVEKKPLPKATEEKPPLPPNTKISKIADNDVGQAQARLFLMGYGADANIDGTHASLDVMLKKYAQQKKILEPNKDFTPETHKKAFDQMNADWEEFAKSHPASFKAVVDKGAAIRDNHDHNKDVLQMQTVLLAMGGKFNRYGLDGKNWNETRGAIDAVAAPEGQLGKLLAPYKIENSPWYKPGPTPPKETTPDNKTPPGKTDTPPVKTDTPPVKKIENVWEDPTDDPFGGDGGFIRPVSTPPAPVVKNDQPPPQNRPQDDFSKVSGGNGQQPVVTPPSSDNGALPPRGQMSSYFNANAQSDRGSATRFFSALTAPYVYDSAKRPDPRDRTELIPVPLGGKDGNQGAIFVIGPDRHFATIYNVNGNYDPRTGQYFDQYTHATFDPKYGNTDPNHPGMPVTTYGNKVYDLENEKERKEFNRELEKAEQRQQHRLDDLGANPGPVMAGPPVIVRPPIFFPRPVYGPVYGPPGGVNVDIEIGGRRR